MTLARLKAWLLGLIEAFRSAAPAWPPLIGFEGIAVDREDDQIDAEKIAHLHWPNI